jgi:hypothetical protein
MAGQNQSVERHAVFHYITEILAEITEDWDVGEISLETRLGDLGVESISLVYLIGEMQQYYNLQDLLFQRLRAAAIRITDLYVADIVDFVCELLTTRAVSVGGR